VATFAALELNNYTEEGISVDATPTKADSKFKHAAHPKGKPSTIWRQGNNVVVERIFRGAVQFLSVAQAEVIEEDGARKGAPAVVKTAGGHVSIGDMAETFTERAERLRQKSRVYGHLSGWRLGGLIAKSNDDVRQEVFVIQLIAVYQKLFAQANLPLWLHTYRILSTSKTTGLIELITDCISFDGLKKKSDYAGSLRLHFEKAYPGASLDEAIDEYVKSMAAYSVVTYVLAIKDRHNGNIMMDAAGHVVHIDFGFVFGLAPGKQLSLEKAPWKLTIEMVDVMGGRDSKHFKKYTELCVAAFRCARQHASEIESEYASVLPSIRRIKLRM
jgi:phosphatidylinositol 4-kinase